MQGVSPNLFSTGTPNPFISDLVYLLKRCCLGMLIGQLYSQTDIYKMASEPKELVIVPGADHVDLYDRLDKIPFDKITSFFTENLK